ncbi:MAG TPA: hypothetical protein VNK50_10155 [Calidithermus sp.]|nr:hypothetical protein [Calidithermus sp.]
MSTEPLPTSDPLATPDALPATGPSLADGARRPGDLPERDPIRLGIRELYRSGLRVSALTQLANVSTATIKRYVAGVTPNPETGRATALMETALTWYWIRRIDLGRKQQAVDPQRRFLDRFCPVCVVAPARRPDRRVRSAPLPRWFGEVRLGSLLEAEQIATRMCASGAPLCMSSAIRFACLVRSLHLDPWRAYLAFLEVAPHRRWVRECRKCGRSAVTESPAHRLCERCR